MKATFTLLALAFLLAPPLGAAPADPGAVVLSPADGELTTDSSFTVSFPEAMIPPAQISAGDLPPPVTVEPKTETRFIWQSATEGELTIRGPVRPGTKYRLATAPGLRDLQGRALPKASWEFTSPVFTIQASDENNAEELSSFPRFELSTTYPVLLREAADHIFFQDRDSATRHAAEIVLTDGQTTEMETTFTITPRSALPMARTFDVVVDGLTDAFAHQPLAFLQVFPAGTTAPIRLEWLGAFNHPLEPPQIRAKFSEHLDPDSVTPAAMVVSPAVPGVKLHADGDELIADGAFNPKQRYTVAVGAGLRGIRGFGLEKEEKWGATFRPKESTLVFPEETVFERSARGLRFSFVQVNTGPVTWTLSAVPMERLAEVTKRVAEYKAGEPPFGLPPVGQGKFDANGAQEEIVRDLAWQAPKPLTGPYVLEVTAPDAAGQTIGNRALLYFSEYVLTQKRSEEGALLRVAGMRDGAGAPGLRVHAITYDNVELATATTDRDGLARFAPEVVASSGRSAQLFIVDTPAGPAVQNVESGVLSSGDYFDSRLKNPERLLVVTDRNLYRPGQTVKLYVAARKAGKNELALPDERAGRWEIKPMDGGQPIGKGEMTLNAHGSWDGEWAVPATLATGGYEIFAGTGAKLISGGTFRVEEYRAPLFSVEVSPVEKPGPEALAQVSSRYFHGAPNAGARVHWTATWSAAYTGDDDRFVRTDAYSEHHAEDLEEKEVGGDAELDTQGQYLLRCPCPFTVAVQPGRAEVSWRVEITSPEAQTQTGGAMGKVQPAAAWCGLRAEVQPGPKPAVTVEVNAIDLHDKPANGTPVKVEIFHVRARTVKERIAPFLTRYRNTREYQKVAEKSTQTPAEMEFPVAATGDYVAVLTGPAGVLASTDFDIAGEEVAEFAVENEREIGVSLPEPDRAYHPGEIAPISIRAPFAGVAWVSVETSEVLDTLLVPLTGNAGRIDLPIKKEYAPNATVSVYLLQPGGEDKLPRERIGQVRLQVERPERALQVETKIAGEGVRPGQPVQGEVLVKCGGAPVAGAEFLVFAVDEAVLKLGDWQLPSPLSAFYPDRPHTISTYAALRRFVEGIEKRSLLQKGYVVGDGGDALGNVSLRKEFKTLAYWQAGLTTDATGRIKFEFLAPENLTEYRLVAIGMSDAQQFGSGTSTFKVSKPLLCEPALPRFVRVGDEVTLRAVVRQSVKAKGKLTLRCTAEGLELPQPQPVTREVAQDVPAVFTFPARVLETTSAAKVRFSVTSDFGEEDGVEVPLPILPPSVLRRETVAATVKGDTFRPADSAPASWLKGRGQLQVTLSTSPWLPKLNGLPAILEYPHGCFEQISTRVLAYALMTDLLGTLPDTSGREARYQEMLKMSMKRYEEAILPSGMLPYWPGSESPNPFATALAAWAVREAERSGVEGAAELQARLAPALEKIVNGQTGNVATFTQCLALMVAARPGTGDTYGSIAEDLYLKRDRLSDEARALLALSMLQMNLLPKERAQLAREIAKPPTERAFDPRTFSSTLRAEAITTLALAKLSPGDAIVKTRRERLLKSMENSAGFSTQENLWNLLAFKAIVEAQPPAALVTKTLEPVATVASRNGASAAWLNRDLAQLAAFRITGLPKSQTLTGLMWSEYRLTEPETTRTDRGLRVERVVRNLTDAARLGTAEAPFRLGDQVLITYRLISRNLHFYLALEDLLPAGLETVNPDLPLVAKTYKLPPEEGSTLMLSHSELRDQSTCLYFDEMQPGPARYSVLARVTAVGEFHWPATQVYPMYDARFTGLSTASTCVVKE